MSVLSWLFGPQVKKLKQANDVAGLQSALKTASKDETRAGAAEALGDIGATGATAALTEALNDRSASVRRAAAEALGRIGDAPLITALHTWGGARRWAIAELKCIELATVIVKDGVAAGDAQVASIIERMQAVTQAERAAIEALLPVSNPTVTEALIENLRKALRNYISLVKISRVGLASTAPSGLMAIFATKWRLIDSANESMTDDVCQVLVTAILDRGEVAANSLRELLRGHHIQRQLSDWASTKASQLLEFASTRAV